MRTCAIQIVYPVWADLVPSVATVIDSYHDVVHLETLGDDIAQCFRLTMLVAPERFDPVRELDGPPPHLNALAKALTDRTIPFDAQMIDLDEPWRDTKHLMRHRRTIELTLDSSQHAFEFAPLQNTREPLDEVTNVFMTCMLGPDESIATSDLDVWLDMVHEVDIETATMLVVAAAVRNRLATHLLPLIDAGLVVTDKVFEAAEAVLEGSSSRPKDPLWRLHLHRTDRTYKELIARMDCADQPQKAKAGAKRS